MTTPVQDLIDRSNRLGADPRNTNYAGGNTSAKGAQTDPVTDGDVELLWVKGSGGDLGTLTEAGLAVLRLDRLRALVGVYPGVEREDEMVAAFDYCLHGRGGAAPSIDTAMHALVDAPHVDHLHPDSGIALATAADGEALTRECFGDRVAWVPWRRPGFQLGLDIARGARGEPAGDRRHPGRARHHRVGRRPATSARRTAWRSSPRRQRFIEERGTAEPFGAVVPGYEPCPTAERHARAAALAPVIRGPGLHRRARRSGTTPTPTWCSTSCSRDKLAPLAALGTSCPDHFLRTKVSPMVLDLPPTAPIEEVTARLTELHAIYREDYAAYYDRHATPTSPAMRGADPAIVLVPGVGMFSFGANAQTARVAGEFYINAINVMRGAEAISSYAPISESREVPDRVLGAGGGQAGPAAQAQAAGRPSGPGHRSRIGHRPGDRAPPGRRGCLRRRRRSRRRVGPDRRGRDRRGVQGPHRGGRRDRGGR